MNDGSGPETGGARDAPPAIRLVDICKRFGAVQANRDVNLSVAKGNIHGIIGENGAGKSTLVSILYGFYTADSGTIEIDGAPVAIASSADAIARGIGMVHQHFMLVPPFTVLENVMLGAEGGPLLAEGKRQVRASLEEISARHGLDVDPDARVEDLPVGVKQRVEILKALQRGARILILDEPTGVLTPEETDRLFDILGTLRDEGVTVLLITHKLREIMAITDAVSVMRQGRMVAHRRTAETDRAELAELMVGRSVLLEVDHTPARPGAVALDVVGLGYRDEAGVARLEDVSFQVRKGEIVGIAGVSGNGQSELLDILSGILAPGSGSFTLGTETVSPRQPADPARLRQWRLAHVPEDRHVRGLVLPFDLMENAVLGYHTGPATGSGVLLDLAAMRRHCTALSDRFDVRPRNPDLAARGLSGGNQQKLVLAREMTVAPDVLLVGQPTRGVDIGAIEYIHQQLLQLRDAGSALLLVSVELDEILGLSDRILVMNQGRIVGECARADADARTLGLMMAGVSPASAA